MIRVTVIALSSLKERYLREAAAEYQKRLGGYCSLKIEEIAPIKLPEKPSAAEINAALEREAEPIINKIPAGSAVFPLCIEGSGVSSEEFADIIKENAGIGKSLTFIIGSSYGLSGKVKALAAKRLSFSKMTFPHQLFRIMLLEQLYRAFRINSGAAYHK